MIEKSYPIQSKVSEINPKLIPVDKQKFSNLCKQGCKVFAKKYSCPPVSPTFSPLSDKACVVILSLDNIIKSKNEYTKVKAINSILKSHLYRLLRKYPNSQVYGSGSCRLCKACNYLYPLSCAHPDKMIYSMESVGINVEALCSSLGHTLQWYKKGENYKYGTVVGLILDVSAQSVLSELSEIINTKRSIDIQEFLA